MASLPESTALSPAGPRSWPPLRSPRLGPRPQRKAPGVARGGPARQCVAPSTPLSNKATPWRACYRLLRAHGAGRSSPPARPAHDLVGHSHLLWLRQFDEEEKKVKKYRGRIFSTLSLDQFAFSSKEKLYAAK